MTAIPYAALVARTTPEPNTGCWLWTGAINGSRYGLIKRRPKWILAHRAMWMAAFGPLPPSLFVCHRCDNPPCVNPEHLFLGTAQDNVDDMMRKRRNRPLTGEQNWNAKLTAEDVLMMRHLMTHGLPQRAAALLFRVSDWTVAAIATRRTWAHLPEDAPWIPAPPPSRVIV